MVSESRAGVSEGIRGWSLLSRTPPLGVHPHLHLQRDGLVQVHLVGEEEEC